MFGTNSITGQKFFKDAPANSLFVTSMFFTLQGEGPFAGKPALFVRLAKCNLACSFCDTFFDDGDWLTYEQIEAKAYHTICDYWNDKGESVPLWALPNGENYIKYPNIVLVITGGEPLLQPNLTQYLNRALRQFGNVQIESNGTVNRDIPLGVTLVCSPKCAEKNGKATKYLAPSELILNRADCLKFVVNADQDSPYSCIPDWALQWKDTTGKEIYVSPMNIYNSLPQTIKLLHNESGKITLEQRSTVDEVVDFWAPGVLNLKENEINHKYTAQYCIANGLRLNLQQHIYAGLA